LTENLGKIKKMKELLEDKRFKFELSAQRSAAKDNG
jgi:hypothetical protein